MLEHSILIDGKNAEMLNQACKTFEELDPQIKDLTKTLNGAKDTIKKLCETKQTQVFETTKFIVNMKFTGESIGIDEDKLKNEYPEVYKACYGKTKRQASVSIQKVTRK